MYYAYSLDRDIVLAYYVSMAGINRLQMLVQVKKSINPLRHPKLTQPAKSVQYLIRPLTSKSQTLQPSPHRLSQVCTIILIHRLADAALPSAGISQRRFKLTAILPSTKPLLSTHLALPIQMAVRPQVFKARSPAIHLIDLRHGPRPGFSRLYFVTTLCLDVRLNLRFN